MKNWLLPGIMGIIILLSVGYYALSGPSKLSNGQILEKASEINKQLPRRIDANLYWDRANAEARQFNFYYSLAELAKEEIDIGSFKQKQTQVLERFSCSDPQSLSLLQGEAQINYIYRDKDGELITQILITPAHCVGN